MGGKEKPLVPVAKGKLENENTRMKETIGALETINKDLETRCLTMKQELNAFRKERTKQKEKKRKNSKPIPMQNLHTEVMPKLTNKHYLFNIFFQNPPASSLMSPAPPPPTNKRKTILRKSRSSLKFTPQEFKMKQSGDGIPDATELDLPNDETFDPPSSPPNDSENELQIVPKKHGNMKNEYEDDVIMELYSEILHRANC
jgi:hypothetical protein